MKCKIWIESEGRESATELTDKDLWEGISVEGKVEFVMERLYDRRDGEFAKMFPTIVCVEMDGGCVTKHWVELDFLPNFASWEVTE